MDSYTAKTLGIALEVSFFFGILARRSLLIRYSQ
jgi:hypothetical protein